MYNHARTLLLNKAATTVDSFGGTPVPSEFTPVVLPQSLRRLYDILFAGLSSTEEQIARTDRLMRIVHMPELEPFVLALDARVTYRDLRPGRLIDLCMSTATNGVDITTMFGQLTTLFVDGSFTNTIFTYPSRQVQFDHLRQLWLNAHDVTLRLGAVVIAYLYQVERVRTEHG